MNKAFTYILPGIIPILVVLSGILFHNAIGYYYLTTIDPEYAYLFNGALLGQLKIDLGHIDHPGTPLQILIAFISRIIHVFHTGHSYSECIILFPEVHLKYTNISTILLNGVVLYIAGLLLYRKYHRLIYSLFIQSSPFFAILTITVLGRVIPESIIGIACILMIYYIIVYCENDKTTGLRHVIIFSLISGLGLSIKITYLPLLFIPIVLLKGWYNKIKYILFTFLSFFVFSFPLLTKFNEFGDWVTSLFIHSGRYGQGEKDIINITGFKHNLHNLFIDNKILIIILILSVITLLVISFNREKRKLHIFRALLGIQIAIIVQFIIVAKHFAFHYMVPAQYLSSISILLLIKLIFNKKQPAIYRAYETVFLSVIITVLLFITGTKLIKNYSGRVARLNERVETLEFVNRNLTGKPIVIVPENYRGPFVERGLIMGYFYSGKHRYEFGRSIKKYYPDTYFYLPWKNAYFVWGNHFDIERFKKKYHDFYLYIGKINFEIKEDIVLGYTSYKYHIYYQNEHTNEYIYRFTREDDPGT